MKLQIGSMYDVHSDIVVMILCTCACSWSASWQACAPLVWTCAQSRRRLTLQSAAPQSPRRPWLLPRGEHPAGPPRCGLLGVHVHVCGRVLRN